jgi:alpha-tubulin suppressor-like RCC1 family protein
MRRVRLMGLAVVVLAAASCKDATAPLSDAGPRVRAQLLSTLRTTAQVGAGYVHTCALKTDGTVVCWGDNTYGQLAVPAGLSAVAQLSVGAWHSCALKTDATVVCWGNYYGGIYGETIVPAGLASVAQISAGDLFTCALKTDGTVVCWGVNSDGQATVPTGLASVVQVSTGTNHACALKADGTVVCWGGGTAAGWPDFGQATVPAGLNSVAETNASGLHTCVLKTDSTVFCWGASVYGGVAPAGLTSVAYVSGNSGNSCALKTDGTVVCWGWDAYGGTDVPVGLASVTQVSPGGLHTCAVKSDGTVVCWGDNSVGESTAPAGLNLLVASAQSINFTSIAPIQPVVGASYALAATASSGLAVSFTSLTPTTCTVNGTTANFVASGACTIAADQAGNAAYFAAPEQTQSITIISAAQAAQNMLTAITSMGLPNGVANSLSATIKNLDTSNLSSACGKLGAFVNQVNAKSGAGQLTATESSQLLSAANAITASLGCN